MKATGLSSYFRPKSSPATYALIGLAVAIYVISWLMRGKLLAPLAFMTDWSQPWGILTYPFASAGDGGNFFWFLLELYWLYWVGTSVESDLRTPRFVGLFFALTVVAALFIWLGMLVIHPGKFLPLSGLELPIAGLTVVWGVRHRHESILLMFILPIPGWLLAWLTVGIVLFGYGTMLAAPILGAFACLHLGLAYLYAADKIPNLAYGRYGGRTNEQNLKRHERRDKKYFEDVRKREQEREERERLRKLFENSMKDDENK